MRILALGLGGAGGRIVNHLYRTDRHSSKVACVQALAVDVDKTDLARLTGLPDTSKIYFPPLNLAHPDDAENEQTATIDIAEVCSRVQTMASGETDAVIFCIGLGGTMVDTAPHIIASLRSSMTEPIFALVTLPCLSEGERCSAKAADDIDTIAPMLDGMIVFDNETWHKKVKFSGKMETQADQGLAVKIGLKKKKEPALSPTEKMYSLLNDAIIRRLSLMLRAGEFKADGGLELAEVVLDAGEVLNTIRGMGFITIGYAVEQLPTHPLDFLARLRPAGFFADEHMKKASRIVDLAKQAIYHEISAPCDITSAHKALILIAGPSHELSMKGFMTVRKWIDRSIAGLETRSGDYPVTSTKFVAIIIMLSGLENIPRITELREIRTQIRTRATAPELMAGDAEEIPVREEGSGQPAGLRDEMITLDAGRKPRGNHRHPLPANAGGLETTTVVSPSHHPPPNLMAANPDPRKREQPLEADSSHIKGEPVHAVRTVLATRSPTPRKEKDSVSAGGQGTSRDQERRRIEQELQRQRLLAVGGIRGHEHLRRNEGTDNEPEGIRHSEAGEGLARELVPEPAHMEKQVIVSKQATKRVVIHKKSGRKEDSGSPRQDPRSGEQSTVRSPLAAREDNELLDSWIRQVADRKKEALSNEGGAVRIDENPAATRDTALLHTDLKRERTGKNDPDAIGIRVAELPPREISPAAKKRSRTDDKDDLSWVE